LNKYDNLNPNYASWRTNKLVFDDANMRSVVKDLSDYFGIMIQLDSEKIALCRLTSTFQSPTIEEVLEVLQITLKLYAIKTDDGYLLSGKGC